MRAIAGDGPDRPIVILDMDQLQDAIDAYLNQAPCLEQWRKRYDPKGDLSVRYSFDVDDDAHSIEVEVYRVEST